MYEYHNHYYTFLWTKTRIENACMDVTVVLWTLDSLLGDEILEKVYGDAQEAAAEISWSGMLLSNSHKDETVLVEWLCRGWGRVSSIATGHCGVIQDITGWSLFRKGR